LESYISHSSPPDDEGKRANVMRALLFLLSGICIIYPIISIYAHKTWWISMPIDGALGFSATSKSPGIGFIIAITCAISLIAYGIITILIVHPADSNDKS